MACSVYMFSLGLSAATLNSSSFHPVFSIPTSLQTLAATDLLSVSVGLPTLNTLPKVNHTLCGLCIWLFHRLA